MPLDHSGPREMPDALQAPEVDKRGRQAAAIRQTTIGGSRGDMQGDVTRQLYLARALTGCARVAPGLGHSRPVR